MLQFQKLFTFCSFPFETKTISSFSAPINRSKVPTTIFGVNMGWKEVEGVNSEWSSIKLIPDMCLLWEGCWKIWRRIFMIKCLSCYHFSIPSWLFINSLFGNFSVKFEKNRLITQHIKSKSSQTIWICVWLNYSNFIPV